MFTCMALHSGLHHIFNLQSRKLQANQEKICTIQTSDMGDCYDGVR